MQALTKQTFKIFWQHARAYKPTVFLLAIGILGIITIDTFKPFLYKHLFDILSTTKDYEALVHIAWQILAISTLHHVLWRGIIYINNFFQPRVMSDLLNTCYAYLQEHSYSFFNNNFVGSLVTKIRRYQKSFEDIADQFYFNIGRTAIQIVVILFVLSYRFWILGLVIFIWCIIYTAFAYFFSQFKLPYDLIRANTDTKTTGHLADTITNNLNLKIFSSQATEYDRFKHITDELFRIRKLTWDLGLLGEVFQGGFMVILEFVMVYLSLRYWKAGILTIGDFALIQSYLIQMFDKLWDLGRYIRNSYESIADANEMTQILMTPHEIVDTPGASELLVKSGTIAFDHVTFGYNKEQNVFDNLSLQIRAGQRVAFVGPSGGGKTTIVKLLLQFFDIQNGKIHIDGQNIANVSQNSLRNAIALVPQEPILFHRSLMDNIRYAKPDASEEEVVKAAKLAHCHEFISGFPEGYETLVGERGVKLSGGERQRVAIARAILKDAPILVLDEATSSLDSESELLIQDALKNLMKDRTTIVIAHRLSTIMQMDRIIVLEAGKIIEDGKHEELLKAAQGTYQKLWHIQAGGFA